MATLAPHPVATPAASRLAVRTGWAMSGLVIAVLAFDAGIKLAGLEVVTDTAASLGWPTEEGFWKSMGAILLGCTLLYAWPRTAMLGALLLTAYLGGAVATHARIGSPIFSHLLFGVYVGVLMWGGLWLRDPRVRQLLPIA